MAYNPASAFNVAGYNSFDAFHKAGCKLLTAADGVRDNVRKAILAAVIVAAMREPAGIRVRDVVDGAFTALGRDVNQRSEASAITKARAALSYAIAQGFIPPVTAGMSERDALAKVEAFCQQYTLTGLYAASLTGRKEKATERREEKATETRRAEEDARAEAGVRGPVPWSVAGLNAVVQPVIMAAKEGNPDAIATLEAMRAAIAAAIVEGEGVIAAAKPAPKRQRKAA